MTKVFNMYLEEALALYIWLKDQPPGTRDEELFKQVWQHIAKIAFIVKVQKGCENPKSVIRPSTSDDGKWHCPRCDEYYTPDIGTRDYRCPYCQR